METIAWCFATAALVGIWASWRLKGNLTLPRAVVVVLGGPRPTTPKLMSGPQPTVPKR